MDDCNVPVLLKYTKTISCDLDKVIYNLSNKSKIIYMNFPNKRCYIGIGQCLSMKINSKEELKNLKNKKYNVVSNAKNDLVFLGGASFDFNKKPAHPWTNIPKGKFVLPKLLISKLNDKIEMTYIRKIDKNSRVFI